MGTNRWEIYDGIGDFLILPKQVSWSPRVNLHSSKRTAGIVRLRFILRGAISMLAVGFWCIGVGSLQAAGYQSIATLRAKPTVKLLGARQPGAFFIREDGGHAALQVKKGSREAMLIDGQGGPLFDEVARCSATRPACELSICFSADGKRVAYLGRRGDQIIPVIDGQEGAPVADVSNIGALHLPLTSTREGGQNGRFFHFSADGSRLAYLSAADNNVSNIILDGKKGPDLTAIDLEQLVFAGNHLLYVAQDWNGWHLVINDKPRAAAYESIESLKVSRDGGHYAYIAQKAGKKMVVADRAEGPPHGMIEQLVILEGGKVAYFADGTLILDGKEITTEATPFSVAYTAAESASLRKLPRHGRTADSPFSTRFAFSPDGTRYAYVKQIAGGLAAVVDGKEQLQYEQVSNVRFSPSGKHVAYVGQKRLINYVVIDGMEMDGQNTVADFRFSDDGNRYAYTGFKDGTYTVVIDGKESQKYRELAPNSLQFSPHSQHCVYAGSNGYLK